MPPDPAQAARFRERILPFMPNAFALARYLTRDDAAAEDVTQDAMLKAFRGMAGFRDGDPKAWLLAIVRRAFLDSVRSRGAWPRLIDGGAENLEAVADDAPGAEQDLIRRDDAAALRAAIEAIPEPFREALVLRDLEEMSYAAIAEITEAPVGTVMSRLSRARRLLARRLGQDHRP